MSDIEVFNVLDGRACLSVFHRFLALCFEEEILVV